MAVYAIGDLQGCYDPLRRLLDAINFQPEADQLWLVGDLVNRGPQSLECLRFVASLGEHAVTVLGNHDLSLLASAAGYRTLRPDSTLNDILNANDCDALLHWLRQRPLLHHDADLGYTMLHAGLPPQWDLAQAQDLAAEVESVLRSDNYLELLATMFGDTPTQWSDDLTGAERWRFVINCLTRLRYCSAAGQLDLHAKGAPGTQAAHLLPWFRVPERRSAGTKIVFGHWSTLGCVQEQNVFSIDTGCVWGNALTALRLDTPTPEYHQVACATYIKPSN